MPAGSARGKREERGSKAQVERTRGAGMVRPDPGKMAGGSPRIWALERVAGTGAGPRGFFLCLLQGPILKKLTDEKGRLGSSLGQTKGSGQGHGLHRNPQKVRPEWLRKLLGPH